MDDDYEFGNPQVLPLGRDNREDYRLTARARARVWVESPEPEQDVPDAQGPTALECQIRDISARGLSLVSPEPLTPQSLLVAEVVLGNRPNRYRLTVEVMWCREAGQDYLVGIRVLESDETDYLDWMEAVASALVDE